MSHFLVPLNGPLHLNPSPHIPYISTFQVLDIKSNTQLTFVSSQEFHNFNVSPNDPEEMEKLSIFLLQPKKYILGKTQKNSHPLSSESFIKHFFFLVFKVKENIQVVFLIKCGILQFHCCASF